MRTMSSGGGTWVAALLTAVGAAAAVATGVAGESRSTCAVACASGTIGGCPSGYHVADDQSGSQIWQEGDGVHPTTCKTGSCTSKHGLCELEGGLPLAAALDLAEIAATAEEPVLAERALQHARVRYNAERSSMQVENCLGETVGSFPVSRAAAQVLAAIAPAGQ